jgi:hypothetical protein
VKELDAKIFDLLIQPEHLDTAYDVAEHLSTVQDRLQSKFWDTLEQEIIEKIRTKGFEIYRQGKPTAGKAQIAIYEKRTEKNSLRCEFKVEQEGGLAPVFFGISWNDAVAKDRLAVLMSNAAVKVILSELRASLAVAGFKPTDWWIGWKYMDNGEGLRGRSIAIALASGNGFEERVVAELQGLIEEYLTPVQELNRTLARVKT